MSMEEMLQNNETSVTFTNLESNFNLSLDSMFSEAEQFALQNPEDPNAYLNFLLNNGNETIITPNPLNIEEETYLTIPAQDSEVYKYIFNKKRRKINDAMLAELQVASLQKFGKTLNPEYLKNYLNINNTFGRLPFNGMPDHILVLVKTILLAPFLEEKEIPEEFDFKLIPRFNIDIAVNMVNIVLLSKTNPILSLFVAIQSDAESAVREMVLDLDLDINVDH